MKNLKTFLVPTVPSLTNEFFDDITFNLATPLSKLINEFFSNNDDFKKLYGANFFEKASYPKLDIIQKSDKLLINAEIPGLTKDDIEVKLEDEPELEGVTINDSVKLTICGSKRQTKIEENDSVLLKELKHSAFSRSIFINKKLVDVNSYEATFNNGILEIVFKLNKSVEKSNKDKIKVLEIK